MKKGLIGSLLAAAFATTLIACGGSGGGSHSPLSLTGRAVQQMQWRSIISMANGGLPLPPFGGMGEGGTTGSSTTGGGGAGFPSMGGFVRNFGGPNGVAALRRGAVHVADTTGGTTGSTGGTDGGGPGSDFYYDEWLNLWVQWSFTDNSYDMDFFVDQEKTQPAGFMHSTFTGQWDAFPISYTSEYGYTAGPLSGAHGFYNWTQATEFTGSLTYDDTYADGSTDHGTSQWNEETSTWSSEWHAPNNTAWYMDSGTWNADGSGTFTSSNSNGWSSTWVYNADWSGHAHFEGPDPKLPAEMTWDTEGNYHITYADGTSESWSWRDFWSEESGTTGAGSDTGTTGAR